MSTDLPLSTAATVIHIKDAPKDWQTDPRHVYIGRQNRSFDGYFGNPYRLRNEDEREPCLRHYEAYLRHRLDTDPIFRQRVRELHGKVLVCYCAPLACHGHLLAEYAAHLHTELQEWLACKEVADAEIEQGEQQVHSQQAHVEDLFALAGRKAQVIDGPERFTEWRKRFWDRAITQDVEAHPHHYTLSHRVRLKGCI